MQIKRDVDEDAQECSQSLANSGSLESLAQRLDFGLRRESEGEFWLKCVCVFVGCKRGNERGVLGYLYGGPQKEPLELWIPRTSTSGHSAGSFGRVGS